MVKPSINFDVIKKDRLRGCRRCGGAVTREMEEEGRFIIVSCVMCGSETYIDVREEELNAARRRARRARGDGD